MRQVSASVGVGIVLLAAGCNLSPHRRDLTGGGVSRLPADTPTAAQLVAYLNENAARVQAVRCNRVAMDCTQNNQAVGLDGSLVCQKPRNFRLKAKVLGQPGVDIGSNQDEFWYWISKADPPYVYHCSYQDLSRPGGVNLPFPFQPDMIMAALGMADYNPNGKYEVKTYPQYPQYLELVESAVSPQGEPVQRVTVFNRAKAAPGQSQVVAHVLKDARGGLICKATIQEPQVTREGVVLPRKVTLVWPAQRIEMKMQLFDMQLVQIEPQQAERYFQRTDLSTLQSFDLARRVVDGPGGAQRASFPAR
jgi:hypothetical protein